MEIDNLYGAKCRVILAREFNIAPDDINIDAFLKCIERAFGDSFKNGDDISTEAIIKIIPKEGEEEDVILGEFGHRILERIFKCEYPFENYIETLVNSISDNEIKMNKFPFEDIED